MSTQSYVYSLSLIHCVRGWNPNPSTQWAEGGSPVRKWLQIKALSSIVCPQCCPISNTCILVHDHCPIFRRGYQKDYAACPYSFCSVCPCIGNSPIVQFSSKYSIFDHFQCFVSNFCPWQLSVLRSFSRLVLVKYELRPPHPSTHTDLI